MTKEKIGRIAALATAVMTVLLGVAFIVCCAHLYFTGGDQPFSRESVGNYLLPLLVPSVITIALFAFGIIFNVYSGEKTDTVAPRTNSEILSSMKTRYADDAFNKAFGFKETEKKLSILKACSFIFSLILFTFALVYFCLCNFTVENLNSDVISALAVSLPMLAVGLGIHIPRLYAEEKMCKDQINRIKEFLASGEKPQKRQNETAMKKVDYLLIAKIGISICAVVLVILGVFNGGMADVLGKAIKICTECIGLG